MNKASRPLPPLNALRMFEVVARTLNFRMAADELGVTHAAVGQQIRSLEAALAVKLFERLPRGVRLTDAGQRYATNIRRALELIVEATSELSPEPSQLTISVTPSFASKWLIPKLSLFTDAHPDVDLRLLATDRLSRFQTDGVDIAVRYGRPPFGPGLNSELLLKHRIIAVASPALLDRMGSPATFDALQQFVLLHDAHNYWPQFIAQDTQQPLKSSPKNIRFNHTTLALEAAISGQGIALASHYFVEDDIAAGRLVRVFLYELQVEAGLHLVWPRKAQASDALVLVQEWLKEQVLMADERISALLTM